MKQRWSNARAEECPARGFSLLELLISMALILVISAISVPALRRALANYKFDSAASQVAGIFKLGRSEAVRKNKIVACRAQQFSANSTTNWNVWVDSNSNSNPDATEAQALLPSDVQLLPAGSVPNPALLNVRLGTANVNVLSGITTAVAFDARGAVNYGGAAPSLYLFFLGTATSTGSGYRAVVVMPSGVTQIWASSDAGDWFKKQ